MQKKRKTWGILTSLDLHDCNPEAICDAQTIRKYVVELCQLIKVNRFGECTIVHFGERTEVAGYSVVQLIETSLISGHFANKTNSAYIDIFSCGNYDPDIAATFSQQFFQAGEMKKTVLCRY